MAAENRPTPISLSQNDFLDSETGQLALPSLIPEDAERSFKIRRNHYLGNHSLDESIKLIRRYSIADEYLDAYARLSDVDLNYLRFIANFKSIQQIHAYRQAELFPEFYGDGKHKTMKVAQKSLVRLTMLGLIDKWSYLHPVYQKDVNVYTLSGNGFRFLEYFFGNNDHYFHPSNFFQLPDFFHVRFWETTDIYQTLVSLPAYKDSSYFFNNENIVYSPLQISFAFELPNIQNLVIYPTLQIDRLDYYQNVIAKWNGFVESGDDLSKPINELPHATNVLTFYATTVEKALFFTQRLRLAQWRFPIVFIIGTKLRTKGAKNAFYRPVADSSGESGLYRINAENIMDVKYYENTEEKY